ncbi:MAG TPA: hypothetical protein PLJ38_12665 [bacterium]|nr:hypothetical protein [bacterium]
MLDDLKYRFNQFMIKLYLKHFGKGLNPVYIIKILFEFILTLVIAGAILYFLLPE